MDLWRGRTFELYEAAGDLEGQAMMAMNLGVIGTRREQTGDETVNRYREASDRLRQVGMSNNAALSEANLGEVLATRGASTRRSRCCAVPSGSCLHQDSTWWNLRQNAARAPSRWRVESSPRPSSNCGLRFRSVVGRPAATVWQANEVTIYLADCLVRSGRPLDGFDVARTTCKGAGPEDGWEIFGAAIAAVSAREH